MEIWLLVDLFNEVYIVGKLRLQKYFFPLLWVNVNSCTLICMLVIVLLLWFTVIIEWLFLWFLNCLIKIKNIERLKKNKQTNKTNKKKPFQLLLNKSKYCVRLSFPPSYLLHFFVNHPIQYCKMITWQKAAFGYIPG